MRKGIITAGMVLAVVLFASCKRNAPEEVVKKFYTHLYKMEYNKVQDFVLPEHHHYYSFMVELMKHIPASEMEKFTKTEVEVLHVECRVSGDTTAICSCMVKVDGQEIEHKDLQLKKVGKSWLVDKGMENKSFIDEDIPVTDFDMDEEDDSPVIETEEGIIIE